MSKLFNCNICTSSKTFKVHKYLYIKASKYPETIPTSLALCMSHLDTSWLTDFLFLFPFLQQSTTNNNKTCLYQKTCFRANYEFYIFFDFKNHLPTHVNCLKFISRVCNPKQAQNHFLFDINSKNIFYKSILARILERLP